MKRIIVTIIFSALLSVVTNLYAGETKIGVVDLQRAVSETREGMAARTEISKRSEQLNNELKGIQSDFDKLRMELDKEGNNMKPETRAALDVQLQQKSRDFQKRQREGQEELKQLESDLLQKILSKFSVLIAKIGDEEKYEIILDQTSGVRFYSKNNDITPLLIKKADEAAGK